MASRNYVDDYNEELASKMNKQLSIIKSYYEKVSVIGEPLESLASIDEFIAQKDRVNYAFSKLISLRHQLVIEDKEDEASQASEYDCDTSLADLNDDCLYSILRWFSLKDQVCVERVNNQWQRAALRCIQGQEAVELSGNRNYCRYNEKTNIIHVLDDKFKKHFSPFISQLASLRKVHFWDLKLFCSQFCLFFDDWKQPIESIKFTKCEVHTYLNESWQSFAERYPFHSLKAAEFDDSQLDGDFLAMLFQKAGHNLKALSIDGCVVTGVDPFKYLPNSIEKLVVGNEGRTGRSEIVRLLTNEATWLPAITIKEVVFKRVELSLVEQTISQMPALESLNFTLSYSHSNNAINGKILNGFRSLKSLSIELESRDELKDLQSLKSFNELKRLKMKRFRTTPSVFAKLIQKMPNLESLELEFEMNCQCRGRAARWEDEYHSYGRKPYRNRLQKDPCQQNFLQPLAVLSKLRALDVNRADEEGLAKLLDKGLLALRKLTIAHVSNAAVIQAFVKAAKAEPKKEFVLKWDGLSKSDVAHIDFPRNVRKPGFCETYVEREYGHPILHQQCYTNNAIYVGSDDYYEY